MQYRCRCSPLVIVILNSYSDAHDAPLQPLITRQALYPPVPNFTPVNSHTAPSWFHSYSSGNRQQFGSIDGSSSTMACPRALYSAPYSLPFTTLLPLYLPPCWQSINCPLQTKAWITSNLLKLTSKKPELMVVVPKGKLWMVGDFIHPPSGWLPNPPFFSDMQSHAQPVPKTNKRTFWDGARPSGTLSLWSSARQQH